MLVPLAVAVPWLTAQAFLVIAFASCMANLNPEWGKLFTLSVPPWG